MNKKKQKIVFRADGNHSIGLGHFIRTLALADMLSSYFYTIFALQLPTLYQRKNVLEVCDRLVALPEGDTHFEYFLNTLQGDEIVVLDNYYYDTNYQKKIKEKGSKLVCIDDMHDKHYLADIIINHAPGLSPEMFSCEVYTKFCLGLDYLLLRKPFLEAGKNYKKTPKPENIFICFGGSDYYNLTLKALEACLTINSINEINIVIGSAYKKQEELAELCAEYEHVKLNDNLDAVEMACLMQKSLLAIVPGSGILLETISTCLPAITGHYADNQKNILAGFKNISGITDIGDFRCCSKNDLALNIKESIHSMENTAPFDFIVNPKENFIKIFKSLNE